MNLFDLSNQVAIVTGSTKGIGLGIARQLAEHGARVVISSRKQAECDHVAKELNAAFGKHVALGISSDMADVPSLERLVKQTVEAFGRLDTLVCNAAKLDVAGSEAQTSPDDFAEVLVVNVRNTFLLAQQALPHLQKRGGSVILLLSNAVTGPTFVAAAYAISKRALVQLMENLAIEWSPYKIRVNSIAPGLVRSEASRMLWEDPKVLSAMEESIPLGRIGEPEDIGACAVYLAARASAHVTGQSILVDGGGTLIGPGEGQRMRDVFKTLIPG